MPWPCIMANQSNVTVFNILMLGSCYVEISLQHRVVPIWPDEIVCNVLISLNNSSSFFFFFFFPLKPRTWWVIVKHCYHNNQLPWTKTHSRASYYRVYPARSLYCMISHEVFCEVSWVWGSLRTLFSNIVCPYWLALLVLAACKCHVSQ